MPNFWIFSVAKEALGVLEIASLSEDETDPNKKKSRIVSEECKGCLSSVGMAVWHCGTFEMDCIKGKYRWSPDSTVFASPGNCTIEKTVIFGD